MPSPERVLSWTQKEGRAMNGLLRTAHRKKWGKVDLEAFVKWDMRPLLNEPDVQAILTLWPEKYSDLDGKVWPKELMPRR